MDTSERLPFDLTSEELERQDRWLRALVRRLADAAEVDDVVQDTWVAALRTRPEVARPRAWLAFVAANFARRTRRAVERREWREREAALPESTPSTADSLAVLDLQEDVLRALRALRDPYQRVILLRYTHGLTVAEIAARTDSSEAAVRQRLKRGLDELREALGQRRGERWRIVPAVTAWLAPATFEMKRNTGLVVALCLLASSALVVALVDWPSGAPRSDAPEVAALAAADADLEPDDERDAEHVALERQRAPAEQADPTPQGAVVTDVRVTGRVIGLRGATPLAGVGVAPIPTGMLAVPSGGMTRPESVARTGADGLFVLDLPEPPGGIVTDAAWIAVGSGMRTHTDEGALLLVAPALSWRGVVQGADGAPLSGVTIEVEGAHLRDYGHSLNGVDLTRWEASITDETGRFERRDLPAELGTVRFWKEGYRAVELPLGGRDELALVVTMTLDEIEYVVSGHVLAPNGAPVAGARVGIGERVVLSGLDGSYEHRIPGESAPSKWDALWAALPPFETILVNRFGAALLADEDRTIERELAFEGEALELGGRVVDADGAPVANHTVHIWNQDGLLGKQSAEELSRPEVGATLDLGSARLRVWSRTDEEGRFLLSGLRDTEYMLRVMNHERSAGWTSEMIRAGTRDALLQLPHDFVREEVTGRIVDRSGRPIAGALLTPLVFQVIIQPGSYSESSGQKFRTDEDGRFVLHRVTGGTLVIRVDGKGVIPLQHVLRAGDSIVDLELVMDRRCEFQLELTGPRLEASYFQLLDASGTPLALHSLGAGNYTSGTYHKIEEGRTRVLEAAESAATLVLLRGGAEELDRMPIVLKAGEPNLIRW